MRDNRERRPGGVRGLITYTLFPLTFVGTMTLAYLGLKTELSPSLILAGVAAMTVVVVALFERIHPAHEAWNKPRGDVGTDALHAIFSGLLLPHVLEVGLTILLLGIATSLSEKAGVGLWPMHWPLPVQLLIAMVISQLGEYFAHRAMHEVPLLWRLHAIHHSPSRLYWLNAARFHPLDTALLQCVALSPLIILGAGAEILLLYSAWVTVHGLFQHSNIALKLGWLNYIFSMSELHRWHHSRKIEEANANYGNNIILWDLVFGTFYYPSDRDASADVGLSDLPNFPTNYSGQLLAPFMWETLEGDPD